MAKDAEVVAPAETLSYHRCVAVSDSRTTLPPPLSLNIETSRSSSFMSLSESSNTASIIEELSARKEGWDCSSYCPGEGNRPDSIGTEGCKCVMCSEPLLVGIDSLTAILPF